MSTGIQLGASTGVTIPHADSTLIAPLTLGRPGPQGPEGETGPPGSAFAFQDKTKTEQFRPADEDTTVGWGGSDVCENIQLKDGRDMFFWGDTLIGDLTPSNDWVSGFAFHKRSITITDPGQQMDDGEFFDQDSDLLTPLKTPPGTPATSDEWFWFGGVAGDDGGDTAWVFTTGITGSQGGVDGFSFAETRRCALAVFDISDPTNITLTRWDLFHETDMQTGIVWGETAHLHEDGYIYLLGRRGTANLTSDGFAMRVPASDVWGPKEFWDGSTWTVDATPAPVGEFPTVPNGLRYQDGVWFGLVVPFYGEALEIWTAPEITGPWSSLGKVWYFPDTANCFYYSPRFVPQWDDQTGVAVIVARNSKEAPLEAWEYQPQVARISPLLFRAAANATIPTHTHTSGQVTDTTTVGRAVMTAATAAAARTAIGAGTSSLALGTTDTTAAAGDHTHTPAQISAGNLVMTQYRFNGHPVYLSANGQQVYINADPATPGVLGDLGVRALGVSGNAPVVHPATYFNSTTDQVDSTTPSSNNSGHVMRFGARGWVRIDMFWKRTTAAGGWTKILELPAAVPTAPVATEGYIINVAAGGAPARIKINANSRDVYTIAPAGTFNGQINYFL